MTPSPLLIKAPNELASVFEVEIDHPLGLLKVKSGNLRGILIVVRVKLEKKRQKSQRIKVGDKILINSWIGLHGIPAKLNFKGEASEVLRLIL